VRLFLALIIPLLGQAQTPSFAVSSIKPSRPDAQMRDMKISVSGPNLRVVNCTLDELLGNALQVRRRSEGGPEWAREQRFDIQVNSEPGTTPNSLALTRMVLQLLRDRFKRAFHQESREVPGLALTLGRKQPALSPAKDRERREVTGARRFVFRKIGMAEFARTISGWLNSPIVDRTDLKGEFDFTVQPDDYRSSDDNVKLTERLRSAIEALGFKLVNEKVIVDYVTVDHAELPDEN
jgi:uncharacterized protein (TIGR03435 family)